MKNFFITITTVLLLIIAFLIGALVFAAGNYKTMVKEKETLILQNDSLHILHLQTKNHLQLIQSRIDSLCKCK